MDNSLRALCDAIKKIAAQLKPQLQELSFLIMTGRSEQGKSSLLKQSTMEEVQVLSEQHAKIYFNQQGIIVELGEGWLSTSNSLMQSTLKQLNKCNRYLKITGIILCIDVNHLLPADPMHFAEQKKAHLHLLGRFGINLGYPLDLAIIFTKMDTLAGFSEFYQMEHATDLVRPLGFTLECINQQAKKIELYSEQFNHFVEAQNQQVINKMHPVRSTIKRSLIREFPLQLAGLKSPIQSLIKGISPQLFDLHAIYFTSAEQGGVSIDRLNRKIQHEYALVVQDTFPQATNFRAYFVSGALRTIQEQFSRAPEVNVLSQKPLIVIACGVAALCILILTYSHHKASRILDEASKELLAYDVLINQGNNDNQALYHLSSAASKLDKLSSNSVSLPSLSQLKHGLHNSALNRVQGEFFPSLIGQIEQMITNPSNTPITRYKALKTYLMLSQPEHFSAPEIEEWFAGQWKGQSEKVVQKQLALLKNNLSKPVKNITVKSQLISDARNYLNALPTSYLYYSLAKEHFTNQKQSIAVEGFVLATNEVPVFYTKEGFKDTTKQLATISHKLQAENWILARQDLAQLHDMLLQAYCFDYATWWQTFMRKSQPLHYQSYQQGREVTHQLQQSNALAKLMALIQQETKPDLSDNASTFNQLIANKFTDLNIISQSAAQDLNSHITDLERFISTLSVINDGGKTAFTITRARFLNEHSSDPVSLLYTQAQQLPEPLSRWTKQIAGDTWSVLIQDTRKYVNEQWQQTIYKDYEHRIAKRYPLDSSQSEEINVADFNSFFATHGALNSFTDNYIKPFLDTSSPQWKPKAVNDFVIPMSSDTLDAIIRANVITNMFFPNYSEQSQIDFTLQKIGLDPVISSLHLEIGTTKLMDSQTTESLIRFSWPQNNAKLSLDSIEGNHYEIAEQGAWAIFKLLEKVNVLIDEQDSSSLQILFEINSNSGRYLLKTNNQVNPFTPGILNGFSLQKTIV